MENKDFQLNGTNEEKAKQLADRIKQGRISKETLDAILPHEKEFFKCLVDVFRAQLDTSSKDFTIYMEIMNNIVSNLTSILPNEKLDCDTRGRIIDLIYKIADDIKNAQEKNAQMHERTSTKIIDTFTILFVIGLASYIIFGINGRGGSSNNNSCK